MKLVKAERTQLERIVAISKRAFETDVAVGGAVGDYPPEYDSVIWHEQMLNEGHLFQAMALWILPLSGRQSGLMKRKLPICKTVLMRMCFSEPCRNSDSVEKSVDCGGKLTVKRENIKLISLLKNFHQTGLSVKGWKFLSKSAHLKCV